jgi:hypothetical protein
MGFGPFSSESSSTVETTSTAFNQGFSEIGGAATSINLNIAGKKSKGGISPVINLTDQGAIKAAQEISSASIRSVELFGSNLTQLFEELGNQLRGQGADAISAVTEANRGEVENIALQAMKWGALALAVYLATRVLMGVK